MQYFKHMSNMRHDIKIDRLIDKYGVEGYGLYVLILESISQSLDTKSFYPDLEETSEDIARKYKINLVRTEEIILFCMQQGLFDQDEITGRIVCHKMYKFLDTSMTGSPELRKMITKYKENHDVMTYHDMSGGVMPEENRKEENRKEENKGKEKHPILNVPIGITQYKRICEEYGKSVVDDYISRAVNYVTAKGKKHYSDYAATAENWIKRDNVKPLSKGLTCPACGVKILSPAYCPACGWIKD